MDDAGGIPVPVQLPGYADSVAVVGLPEREIEEVFSILRSGGDGGWIGLSRYRKIK